MGEEGFLAWRNSRVNTSNMISRCGKIQESIHATRSFSIENDGSSSLTSSSKRGRQNQKRRRKKPPKKKIGNNNNNNNNNNDDNQNNDDLVIEEVLLDSKEDSWDTWHSEDNKILQINRTNDASSTYMDASDSLFVSAKQQQREMLEESGG